MWTVSVLVCALMVARSVSQAPDTLSRVVTLPQGGLRGYRNADYDVFEFFNVHYATAPTGVDKFKAPLSPPMWFGVIDALDQKITCPQSNNIYVSSMNIQENCLVANIHVPNTDQTNLPVIVFVHGGGYLFGWGTMDKPNGLVSSKNIIAVTFNYRLGPHGFLCLGTEDAPGNAGMKDQVALLQWVKNNIANFGGNPDDVTIMGCSAGGSSVDLLMLSGMTNGLFNKVISESGSSVNTFAAQLDPLHNARNNALRLGFTNVTDLNALAEFYKTSPVLDLFDESLGLAKDGYFVFQPCIEKNIGQRRFLEDAPINILKSGNFKKLPVIYGYAKQEGLLRLEQFNEWSVAMNENFADFLPADLEFETETQKLEVAKTVKEFYFGDNLVSDSTVLKYVDYFSDVVFVGGILRNIALRVNAGHDETYLYEYSFTHEGSVSIPQKDELRGATHCDQYGIILDNTQPAPILSAERIEMTQTMRNIIYNFITTGNPTPVSEGSSLPTWPPVGSDRTPYYSVGNTIEVLGVIPAEERTRFWDAIYERYGATPRPPVEFDEADQTESTPQDGTESTPQDGTNSTPQDGTDSTPQDTTDPNEDQQTTTPEPNSATLKTIFSCQFWVLYTIVILIAFK